MSDPGSEDVGVLLLDEIRGQNDEVATTALLASSSLKRIAAAEFVLRNIIEFMSDYELDRNEHAFREACDKAQARLAGQPDHSSPSMVALLALISLNTALLDARFSPPSKDSNFDTYRYCAGIFENTPVRQAVRALYAPKKLSAEAQSLPMEERAAVECSEWEKVDLDNATYYKSGTTSFILRCPSLLPRDESGRHLDYVLKCVLFPWNKMGAVAKATDNYAYEYGAANTPAETVVQPYASTTRWVLMPFQEGPTLNEELEHFESEKRSVRDRIEKVRQVGLLLISALEELAKHGIVNDENPSCQHLDLSPNNIIITPGAHQMKLIDLGINNLYSRQVGITEHDDSVYVAPEIKNRKKSAVADVYSLGIILVRVMCGYAPRDGRVPDTIWDVSPPLARFLEDLVEEDHRKRLLLVKPDPKQAFQYEPLKQFFAYTIELVTSEPEVSTNSQERWLVKLAPTSRELSAQFSRWRVGKANKNGNGQESYLLLFTLGATACWWFIFARTALFSFSGLATLQFHKPPSGIRLAADIICFDQGLIGAKYYSAVLSQLTVRGVPGILARATEIAVRFMAFVALPITIVSDIWKPWLWAWSITAGSLAVVLANWLILTTAGRIYRAGQAENLSAVPSDGKLQARGFEQWWWTMLLYAVVLGLIAFGLETRWMKDTTAYVLGLTLISIGIHYLSKFVVAGSAVRGGIARAFCTAERINILNDRQPVGNEFWPPRLLDRNTRALPRRLWAEVKSAFGL